MIVPSPGIERCLLRLETTERGTMAQKMEITLVDDIDGTPAQETVTFAVDGVNYEIDLNEDHANALRESFAEWVAHARRAGGRKVTTRRTRSAGSGASAGASKIREWARENGYTVSERGRIPAEVREAYDRANG